ncbi:MAG: hypothetical protein LKE30_00510 [Bacteroidales bacterium]|jgi:hypothetical protein|nr:hypothetical protein [Bacteroidales bacterium]
MKTNKLFNNKNIDTILLFLIVFFALSCSSTNPKVYKKGMSFDYDVIMTDSNGKQEDTCSITMTIDGGVTIDRQQKKLKYYYSPCLDKNYYEETTGYIDDGKTISLHPPRLSYMSFTEIVPFPTFTLPIGVETSTKGTLTVKESTFKQLNGKEVEYEYNQEGVDTLLINNQKIVCYLVKGKNTNQIKEFGQYSCTYYFNERYGFVKWVYIKPNGEKVEMILKDCK